MKPESTPLTISAAATVLPSSVQSLASWLDAVEADQARAELSEYRGLTQLLFAQLGSDPARLNDRARVLALLPQQTSFRCAGKLSQTELAYQATECLSAYIGAQGLRDFGMLMYAHSSLNENFFQSSAAYLASKFGLSNTPHFSVGQMDGAALFQALDIANAFFQSDDKVDSALFVAAEKWPLPYPRVLSCATVLGDGAAALAISRAPVQSGLQLCGSIVQCHDGFADPWAIAPASALTRQGGPAARAVAQTIRALLAQHDGAALHGIDLWLPSGPSPAFEAEVAELIGLDTQRVLAEDETGVGYLATVAAPRQIARVLARVRSGDLAPGARVLVWGVGLGGSVGAALFRVVHAGASS